MHAMIYVYVVPYCFLLWFILRRDADHLRRRKLRNQRIKARQAQDPLLGDRYSIQQIRLKKEGDDDDDGQSEDIEDDIEVKRRLNRSNGSRGSDDGADENRDASVTEVSEYDPGSYLFPSARVVRFGRASQPSPPFVEDYDQHHQRQSPLAASTAAALVGSVGNNGRAGGGGGSSVDREREAAVALNQSLRQILRERTVPIRLMESRSVRFLRKIGVGGYGEVYLAEWEGIEVAVKRFVSERPEKNFLKEIEVIRYFLRSSSFFALRSSFFVFRSFRSTNCCAVGWITPTFWRSLAPSSSPRISASSRYLYPKQKQFFSIIK
jgi:hypothetical protein